MSEEFTDDQVFSFTGTVKFYNPDAGYGVISPDGGGAEIVFSYIVLAGEGIDTLSAGQPVLFEMSPDGKHVVRLARMH